MKFARIIALILISSHFLLSPLSHASFTQEQLDLLTKMNVLQERCKGTALIKARQNLAELQGLVSSKMETHQRSMTLDIFFSFAFAHCEEAATAKFLNGNQGPTVALINTENDQAILALLPSIAKILVRETIGFNRFDRSVRQIQLPNQTLYDPNFEISPSYHKLFGDIKGTLTQDQMVIMTGFANFYSKNKDITPFFLSLSHNAPKSVILIVNNEPEKLNLNTEDRNWLSTKDSPVSFNIFGNGILNCNEALALGAIH